MEDVKYFEKIKKQRGTVRGPAVVRAKRVFKWLSQNGWEVAEEKKYYTTGRKMGRIYVTTPKHHEAIEYTARKGDSVVVYRADIDSLYALCNRIAEEYCGQDCEIES